MFCVTSSDDQLRSDLKILLLSHDAWRGDRSAFAFLEYIKLCIITLNEKNVVTSLNVVSKSLHSRRSGI